MMNHKLLTVLNNPYSYINYERLTINKNISIDSITQVMINKIIFEIYDLAYDEISLRRDELFWINNWSNIANIIFLLGCISYKELLLSKGRINKYPAWCSNALKTLPVRIETQIVKVNIHKLSKSDVFLEGYSQVNGYFNELNDDLNKRVNLIFPPYFEKVSTSCKVSPLILNTVSIYVKQNRIS